MSLRNELRLAAACGNVWRLKELLGDERVNPRHFDLIVSLQAALYNHEAGVIRVFLDDGRVDPSFSDDWTLRWAAENGHLDIVTICLKDSRVNSGSVSNNAIIMSSQNGHFHIVKLLLKDKNTDPAARYNLPIRCASGVGRYNIVEILMKDKRVDPSGSNNNAIKMAALWGYYNVIKLLMTDPRVDPSTSDNYALRKSLKIDRPDITMLLLNSDERVWDGSDDSDVVLDPDFNHDIDVFFDDIRYSGLLSTTIAVILYNILTSSSWFNGHNDICKIIVVMAVGANMNVLGNRTDYEDTFDMFRLINDKFLKK